MLNRLQFWVLSVLAGLALVAMVTSVTLASLNRGLQADIGLRQQYVQQSLQLETLYREIVRALAELGARNNDEALRALLQSHGITYSVNPPAAGSPAAGARK